MARKQGSSSFLKKRTKKLLLPCYRYPQSDYPQRQTSKSFLVLFFKKELLLCLSLIEQAGLLRNIFSTK
jgi:hypothetical protein